MNRTKRNGHQKLTRLIARPGSRLLLRGELWVNREVLGAFGFNDDLKGRIEFLTSIGADTCFLPWDDSFSPDHLKQMREQASQAGLALGITMDGPFQRLAQREDLMSLLLQLGREHHHLLPSLNQAAEKTAVVVEKVASAGIELVILGEDIAYRRNLYFSPALFSEVLLPCYRSLIKTLPSKRLALGWHSDGDVSTILPDLVNCGFRFFSLESECVDLLGFKRTHGPRVTLVGGLRTDWLHGDITDALLTQQCVSEIRSLAKEGGFILSSSCGLHDLAFPHRLKKIYRLLDEAPAPSEEGHG
jgi:uroporphyrinogen-III decarboxylase